jgi:hypothetical protein
VCRHHCQAGGALFKHTRVRGLGAKHGAQELGGVGAWAALAANATCKRIVGRAQRDDKGTQIGVGDTVRCGRGLGMFGRMGPCRPSTRVGCE